MAWTADWCWPWRWRDWVLTCSPVGPLTSPTAAAINVEGVFWGTSSSTWQGQSANVPNTTTSAICRPTLC